MYCGSIWTAIVLISIDQTLTYFTASLIGLKNAVQYSTAGIYFQVCGEKGDVVRDNR